MNAVLCGAINDQNIVEFYYDGARRIVEPFCHGISTAGNEVLRGYQISGFSSSGTVPDWKLFNLDEIFGLNVTEETFAGEHHGIIPTMMRWTTFSAACSCMNGSRTAPSMTAPHRGCAAPASS